MTVYIARHMGHHTQGDEEQLWKGRMSLSPLDLGLATMKTVVFPQLDKRVQEANGELWKPTVEAAR